MQINAVPRFVLVSYLIFGKNPKRQVLIRSECLQHDKYFDWEIAPFFCAFLTRYPALFPQQIAIIFLLLPPQLAFSNKRSQKYNG
jgi:hypothetical protein